jgi:hypothetical protein
LPITRPRGPWYRIHAATYTARYFGRRGDNRFDDPLGEFGVLYVGKTLECAFIETLARARDPDGLIRFEFTLDDLAAKGLARIRPRCPLRLVRLSGADGPAALGIDGRLFTGDYAVAQAWSRALSAMTARSALVSGSSSSGASVIDSPAASSSITAVRIAPVRATWSSGREPID